MGIQELMIETVRQMYGSFSCDESVKLFKRQMVIASLERNKGNACKAAKELQVHRNTMGRYIEEFELWQTIRDIRSRHRLVRQVYRREA